MGQPLHPSPRVWWRWALVIILVVIFGNILVSFFLSKMYPSHCVQPSHVPAFVRSKSVDVLDEPRHLYLLADTPLLPLADKDIVVRSAYVNFHGTPGSQHRNSTIMLLEIKKTLLAQKAIESCRVGEHVTTHFDVVPILQEDCGIENGGTHAQVLLFCYDIPAQHLDWAWVAFHKHLFGEESMYWAKSEHPVMFPFHYKESSSDSVLVCAAMLPYYTPYVEDWLRYQMAIGVDHVHMTLESSFLNRGRFDRDFLQQTVEDAYVSVDFWHQWLNETDICDHSLDLALYDCALRFRGAYSYVLFSDPRDFFIPRDPSVSQMKKYLTSRCGRTHCRFKWRDLYYRACASATRGGNVTSAIEVTRYDWRSEGYVVHKLSRILPNDRDLFVLDSSSVVDVPEDKSYMAHLVKTDGTPIIYRRIIPENEKC